MLVWHRARRRVEREETCVCVCERERESVMYMFYCCLSSVNEPAMIAEEIAHVKPHYDTKEGNHTTKRERSEIKTQGFKEKRNKRIDFKKREQRKENADAKIIGLMRACCSHTVRSVYLPILLVYTLKFNITDGASLSNVVTISYKLVAYETKMNKRIHQQVQTANTKKQKKRRKRCMCAQSLLLP